MSTSNIINQNVKLEKIVLVSSSSLSKDLLDGLFFNLKSIFFLDGFSLDIFMAIRASN